MYLSLSLILKTYLTSNWSHSAATQSSLSLPWQHRLMLIKKPRPPKIAVRIGKFTPFRLPTLSDIDRKAMSTRHYEDG